MSRRHNEKTEYFFNQGDIIRKRTIPLHLYRGDKTTKWNALLHMYITRRRMDFISGRHNDKAE